MGQVSEVVVPALGGPQGRRARPLSSAQALAIALALTAFPAIFAVLRQVSCLQTGWGGRAPLWRECSSSLMTAFIDDHLTRGLAAYAQGEITIAQPPGSAALMSALGGLVPETAGLASQRWYLALWLVVALIALLVTVALVDLTVSEPRRDVLQAAVAPVLALGLLLGPDMVGVALATAGIWAWGRHRPALAGALLGAGVLTRTYPGLLAIVISLVVMVAPDGPTPQVRSQLRRLWLALIGTVAIGFGMMLASNPSGLLTAYQQWWSGPPGAGSFSMIPSMAGAPLDGRIAAVLSLLGVAMALSLGIAMVRGARVPVTVAQVALLVVAVVVITSKNLPVQSSLWLVPLVALAGVPWRDHLVWAAAEGAHYVALWYYLGGLEVPDKGLPAPWYTIFLLLRLAAIGRLAWRMWDRAMWPALAD